MACIGTVEKLYLKILSAVSIVDKIVDEVLAKIITSGGKDKTDGLFGVAHTFWINGETPYVSG